MKALRQQIAIMAPTNGRVLIYGESGTGKELVAHAIHAQSLRKEGLFVELNCAAIPEELIESELFGHRKGSFSGAASDKEGKFQRADGGTLFLDEIANVPTNLQPKLLRVLETGDFERVGSSKTRRVDVRVESVNSKAQNTAVPANSSSATTKKRWKAYGPAPVSTTNFPVVMFPSM
jgi:two-component system nitrogen regulation response regulator NtrX